MAEAVVKPTREETLLRQLSSAVSAVEDAAFDVASIFEGDMPLESHNEYVHFHKYLVYEIEGKLMDGLEPKTVLGWVRSELMK